MRLLLLREADSVPTVAGRTLTIRVATYDRIYRMGDGTRERIRPGAFREPLARPRGALRFRHRGEHPGETDDLDNIHGLLTALREDSGALLADFDVFDGAREDKLLRIVASGAIEGASAAMVIREARRVQDPAGPVIDITRVSHLDGVSITPAPAYDDAAVVGLREQSPAARAAAVARERAYWATVNLPGR